MFKHACMTILLTWGLSLFSQEKPKPMKVFILAGQSNMTGMVSNTTLEHIKMFPDTAKEFADIFDKDGNPVALDQVHVSQWKEKDSGVCWAIAATSTTNVGGW